MTLEKKNKLQEAFKSIGGITLKFTSEFQGFAANSEIELDADSIEWLKYKISLPLPVQAVVE